jgi:hypothetical protein
VRCRYPRTKIGASINRSRRRPILVFLGWNYRIGSLFLNQVYERSVV